MPGKTQLLIESLTPERVPDKLAKERIPVFFARKAQKNAIIIEVASKDLEKVFAILRGSCYNIKKVRFRGLGLLYKKCVEAVGLIIGAGLFAALVIGAQSRVLKIEVVGSGSYYESAILSVLDRGGVKKFGKAPESTALLSAEILSFPRVSYCAMNFKGGILTVEVRSEEEYSALSAYPLLSPAAGTVEELVVVRGTPRASVGDVVEAEQLLVEGISVYGEETREVIVIARVKIAFSVSETFEGSEQQALRSAYLKYGEIRDLKAEPAEGGFTVSGTAFAERSVNLG